ncbi:DNA-binding GntR family transcriptional regulator [Prauserella sediminis]|uniref:DNA-binding GntR family transcriptional regulator n=1 Tax=Prauserella sediminis TaxID=577680 RepID=A0A839XUA2_9PSEU|nr:GntR family transcriptional regulator [Prauserella sediminis]MBB3663415.1 DNA-binding GntR family transcriptional regulator [Prauserella sediminis]
MERAYTEIKARYMTLRLAPGEWVDDVQLSQELGLSRTPAREALFLLASEGLIQAHPGGGFTVRPMDISGISNFFEANIVTAKAIAQLVANRVTAAELAELREADALVNDAIRRRSAPDIAESNAALHNLEARIARNEYLAVLAARIHDEGQRLGYLAFGGAEDWNSNRLDDHFARVSHDHSALIDAYENRDPGTAEKIAVGHVRLFRERILTYIASSGTDKLDVTGDLMTSVRLDAANARDAVNDDGTPCEVGV